MRLGIAAIVGTLDYVYYKGYLKQIVVLVITEIGWWALAKFFLKILGWLAPGWAEAQLAVSLAVLLAELTVLLLSYPE